MRWNALGSSGLKQLRDELHLREVTWLFVVDVTALDGSYYFYSDQARLS